MFPGTGIENDIQNIFYSLFFLGKVPLLRLRRGDFVFLFAVCFSGWLSFRATLRRFTRINGFLPLGVPFGDPKGTEKVPATSDSAGGPA